MENQEQQRSLGPFLENRRSFVLLRWLLIILASYLTLFTNIQSENISGIFVMVLMYSASNVAISLLPLRLFMAVRERRLIIVADAVFVCACLYLLQGDGPPIYLPFMGIFVLALAWRDLRVLLFSLLVVSVLYGVIKNFTLFGSETDVVPEQFLALAFFFVVSIFYVILIDRFDRDMETSVAVIEEKRSAETIVELTHALSASMNADDIFKVIVARLSETMDGAECSVVHVEGAESDEGAVLASSAARGEDSESIPLATAPALHQAFHERKTADAALADGTHTLAIPMITRGEVVGLIYFRGRRTVLGSASAMLPFVEAVAGTAANALGNVQLFEEMKHMARTDFLTGLPNHRYFQSTLSREIGRAARHHRSLSLLIIDLDFLKSVNDRFGHPAGDAAIRTIARTISGTCREIDFAARYGGEEFTVILPETDLSGAVLVAERLRKRIAETKLGTIGQITASVGVANYPMNATSKEELIRVADKALYVAKNGGRNQVAHFKSQLAAP